MKPLVIINAVGLTPRLAEFAPSLKALNTSPMAGVFPALTMPAQASMLTGKSPSETGVVANGWFWRELGEVRNWLQNNRLMHGETIYAAAKKAAGDDFTCAKMFWWFNQGSGCDWTLTPKPHYGSDGSKEFDIQTNPPELGQQLQASLGKFPFFNFWGPKAGLQASMWIADATAKIIHDKKPTLTLCYLPHLDYDLQRFGDGAETKRLVGQLDRCIDTVMAEAKGIGAEVMVVSEYGIKPVSKPVYLNRELRKAGLLKVRSGPFGEMLDVYESRAFAVCDHQSAHVYVSDYSDIQEVQQTLKGVDGTSRVLDDDGKAELKIDHANAGDLVVLSEPDSWFAYPYWLDEDKAPDFARSVDIHRKPGYDPCELFVDPTKSAPMLRMAGMLARKKMGMRYRMNIIPLDASIVKGSHGLPATDPQDGPLIASTAVLPDKVAMTDVKSLALKLMEISGA
ncbi:MAG: alkaline phosphatase family protein [Planctomycetota bacterium]|jgi:predicted AlkP superfamily pyrophosphatase or phosphodiesterase